MTSSAHYTPFRIYGRGNVIKDRYLCTLYSVMFLIFELVVAIWKLFYFFMPFKGVWNILLEGNEITMSKRSNAFLENVNDNRNVGKYS